MNKEEMLSLFKTPTAEYLGKPFWSWNGELRKDELIRQVKVMKEMGFGGYFMHSRAGLITEYLGDEWFDLINEIADEGEKLGMESWLYDEDRYPSGSAGGKATIDPKYRMKSIHIFEMPPEKYEKSDDTYALFIAKLDGLDLWAYKRLDVNADVIAAIEEEKSVASDKPGDWKVLRFAIKTDPTNSNFNGTTYLDTMSQEAVAKFIELTHEEYKKRCGDRLGRSIKGIFTDEPNRGCAMNRYSEQDGIKSDAMCFTDDLFEEFEKRYGYNALDILPELFYRPLGCKVAKIKLHYFDLANNLFIERFAVQINEWCKANGIILTGHVLHEDSLTNQTVPNGSLMRFYEAMEYPGVDVLTEHNNAFWIVKQLASATRQLGQKWLLSELYGCTGWQFPFRAHKTVGDWQALFGINFRCQHLSWYSMEGESKRDYPASILHQSPWYHYYSSVENYFGRFGAVMKEGIADCDVLLMNPIESVWCQTHMDWAYWIMSKSKDVDEYEARYREMFYMLTNNHIDFDYGEEDIMRRHYSVEKDHEGKAVLRIGEATYHVVIVGNMLTIRPTTIALLKEFMNAGGKVILFGELPAYIDATPYEGEFPLSDGAISIPYNEKELVSAVRNCSTKYVDVQYEDGTNVSDVYVQVRDNFFGGKAFVVLSVAGAKNEHRNNIFVRIDTDKEYHVQRWDFLTGKRYDADAYAEYSNGCMIIKTDMLPADSQCFVLTEEKEELEQFKSLNQVSDISIKGEFDYSLDEKNVLVLDWVKWRWAEGEWSEKIEVLRADRAIRDAVGIEHRGGEMLQPWFSKLHHKTVYGNIELSYEFDIEKLPSGDVILAGERPDTNDYYVNGVKLSSTDINDIWVDEAFKRMVIPDGALKLGKNIVTVKTSFMRTTNIEALYLVGDFGVIAQKKNSVMVGTYKKIGCENYEKYNMPFYSGNLTYILTPDMYKDKLSVKDDEKVFLSPESFTGACVVVSAEGMEDCVLGWEPYEADVTEAVKSGKTIKVTVAGTRRNTFGPLHQLPKIDGACSPGHFVTQGKQWTDDYSLIDSGLTGIVLKIKK